MTNPFALFRQTPQQLRRARLSAPDPLSEKTETARLSHLETTAAAIESLDVQFPWLRGAEKRFRAE
jgi:hypothetical protein